MSNLQTAVNAQIPLIAVTTRDPMNFPEVITFITKQKLLPWNHNEDPKMHGLYFTNCTEQTSMKIFDGQYKKMVAAEAVLIVVNPPKSHPAFFYGGEVPTPRELLFKYTTAIAPNEELAKALLPPLGGCTTKEAVEFMKITMSRDNSLTPDGLMLTRKLCFTGARGLYQVDTAQPFYEPCEELMYWVGAEKGLFLNPNTDYRLVPRGILADGPPGVGKTEGAKYLAKKFGIPLYRVDIGSVQEKWVGSSEANMAAAFSQLDHEEPCVALFDEIEKVYGHTVGDHGVSERMLAQMLWWLAEHRSRVLVFMTTNNRKILPPELYRKGRIDKVIVFPGLGKPEALQFCTNVLKTFTGHEKVKSGMIEKSLKMAFAHSALPGEDAMPTIAQATATNLVYDLMKQALK